MIKIIKNLTRLFEKGGYINHRTHVSETVSNDFIKGVIIYNIDERDTVGIFYQKILKEVFDRANHIINDADNYKADVYTFKGDKVCEGAMRKPYTMVQIANALLPPNILDETSSGKSSFDFESVTELMLADKKAKGQNIDLLPSNSFYVQAQIYDDCINFILNKVIAVSLCDGAVQKSTFTIQQRKHNIENIFDSICDDVWAHLQMICYDLDDTSMFQSCCVHPFRNQLNRKDYQHFSTNFKTKLASWVTIEVFQHFHNYTNFLAASRDKVDFKEP